MKKRLATFGITAVVLGCLIQGAEAKKVDYEISGQRYSYESTNRQQVEAARKRIEAANAAQAAKARADAKRASDPFAAIFGSQAERDAEQAQADLKRLIAEQDHAAAEAKRQRAALAVKDGQLPQAASVVQNEPNAALERQAGDKIARAPVSNPIVTDTTQSSPVTPAKLRSVSFDFESGIKTTVMGDGTLHEEPFDPTALSRFISENAGPSENVQLDRAETTGSTTRQ